MKRILLFALCSTVSIISPAQRKTFTDSIVVNKGSTIYSAQYQTHRDSVYARINVKEFWIKSAEAYRIKEILQSNDIVVYFDRNWFKDYRIIK